VATSPKDAYSDRYVAFNKLYDAYGDIFDSAYATALQLEISKWLQDPSKGYESQLKAGKIALGLAE
jgi:hypothetical protein